MRQQSSPAPQPPSPRRHLQVYLLGLVGFEDVLTLQRRLVYDVAGDRDSAVLVLCEHSSIITVGREGNAASILLDPEELRAREWRVRWVNRGGGCVLHLAGQLAVYPVLALDRHGLGLDGYLDRLGDTFVAVLKDFGVSASSLPGQTGLWTGNRPIAEVGVAVKDWVTYFGGYCNVNPTLDPYWVIRCIHPTAQPMTSLERERRAPVRPALVRERFIELFMEQFGFETVSLFFQHPSLPKSAPTFSHSASS